MVHCSSLSPGMYALVVLGLHAVRVGAVIPSWQDALMGAMTLSAALPKHGPKPSKELDAKMQKAGQFLYNAYELLQTASQSVEESQEQFRANTHMESLAQNLALGEEMLSRGSAKAKEGQRLKNEAEDALQSTADPLGPQPEPPKEWRDIDAMERRVSSKERVLKSEIQEMKRSAKSQGLSLISVSSETAVAVGQDPVSKQQDDSLLDFLSKY